VLLAVAAAGSMQRAAQSAHLTQPAISKIVRELESLGESEVSSEAVGETVMEHLRHLDDVAYVRFASVYRNFREPKDFENALAELTGDDDNPKPAATARK